MMIDILTTALENILAPHEGDDEQLEFITSSNKR